MPKKKSKGKAKRAAVEAEMIEKRATLRTRMVRWAAISVILALLFSLLVAAISASPSSAATPSSAPTNCSAIDTDGDAISNDIDSDIDGDGTVNGLDEDIDGDGIPNVSDSDPAATNCGADANPPIILPVTESAAAKPDSIWIVIVGVALLGLGYLVLRRVRGSKK